MTQPRAPAVNIDSPLAADSASSSSDPEHQHNTQALSASITNYPIHWGRRYHKYREGAYVFPNDDAESERLHQQHAIFNHYFDGRLFWSPLDPDTTTQVLDLGTGTGRWPIELADSNWLPHAEITGIDLSSIQPEIVPENVFFEIQDCTDNDWCRDEGSIDLIHSRFMAGSLESYKSVIRKSKQYLKEGSGWLELHEIHPTPQCDDGTMPDNWGFKKWEEDCGYTDIHELIYKVPLSAWPRDKKLRTVGKWYGKNWTDGLPGFSYKLLGSDGLGLTREEVELRIMEARKSLEGNQGVHVYLRYWVVYGRRPSEEEEPRARRVNGV